MSGVRLLVSAHKGAFILTSDERRERWDVSGLHFGGWEFMCSRSMMRVPPVG